MHMMSHGPGQSQAPRKFLTGRSSRPRPIGYPRMIWAMAFGNALKTRKNPTRSSYLGRAMESSGAWLALGTIALAAATAAFLRKKPTADAKGNLKRRLSFTSQVMAAGSWPTNVPMAEPIINAVLTFDQPPTEAALEELVLRMLRYDRLGGVPKQEGSAWVMADRESSSLTSEDASRLLTVVDVKNLKGLWDKVHDIIMGPGLLKPDRAKDPWWELVLLRNQTSGGSSSSSSALLVRIHHTLGDGVALVGLVRALLTDKSGGPIPDDFAEAAARAMKKKTEKNVFLSLVSMFQLVCRGLHAAFICLTLGATAYDSNLKFTSPDKPKLAYSGKRTVLLLPSLDLAHVKALKDAESKRSNERATVNDVLTALLAGALRLYCQTQGDPLLPKTDNEGDTSASVQARALLPLGFPRPSSPSSTDFNDTEGHLKNQWCMVSASLPVGVGGPLARLEAVRKTMGSLKNSLVAPCQLFIQNVLLPYVPSFVTRQTCYDTFSRHSCVFTNVPGPSRAILLAGSEVTGMQMVFPNLVAQFSMMSYNGAVYANAVVDPAAVTDAPLLRRCFLDAFKAQVDALLLVDSNKNTGSDGTKKAMAALEEQLRALESAGL